MSTYEVEAWANLQSYWARKAEPPGVFRTRVGEARDAAGGRVRAVGSSARALGSRATPETVKAWGGGVAGWSWEKTVPYAVALLEKATEAVEEYTDPQKVLGFHRDRGREVEVVGDLRAFDLQDMDEYTAKLAWKAFGAGAGEGAAMGALAFVPVAGTVAAIGADVLVMHAMSTAVATRTAYAYGIDPSREDQRHHLERMLTRTFAAQGPKAVVVEEARDAFIEGAGRVRWSQKFRDDHRIAVAVEKLMKSLSTNSANHVPIDKVVQKLPLLGAAISMGTNGVLLSGVAVQSVRYGQTLHLATKYDLTLPSQFD